jgi:hypothetical protein
MIYFAVQFGWGLILTKSRYLDPNIQVDKSTESEDPGLPSIIVCIPLCHTYLLCQQLHIHLNKS